MGLWAEIRKPAEIRQPEPRKPDFGHPEEQLSGLHNQRVKQSRFRIIGSGVSGSVLPDVINGRLDNSRCAGSVAGDEVHCGPVQVSEPGIDALFRVHHCLILHAPLIGTRRTKITGLKFSRLP